MSRREGSTRLLPRVRGPRVSLPTIGVGSLLLLYGLASAWTYAVHSHGLSPVEFLAGCWQVIAWLARQVARAVTSVMRDRAPGAPATTTTTAPR